MGAGRGQNCFLNGSSGNKTSPVSLSPPPTNASPCSCFHSLGSSFPPQPTAQAQPRVLPRGPRAAPRPCLKGLLSGRVFMASETTLWRQVGRLVSRPPGPPRITHCARRPKRMALGWPGPLSRDRGAHRLRLGYPDGRWHSSSWGLVLRPTSWGRPSGARTWSSCEEGWQQSSQPLTGPSRPEAVAGLGPGPQTQQMPPQPSGKTWRARAAWSQAGPSPPAPGGPGTGQTFRSVWCPESPVRPRSVRPEEAETENARRPVLLQRSPRCYHSN